MNGIPIWLAAVLTAITAYLAWLTYLSTRGKTRLEYLVTTNTSVLPSRVADQLQVMFGDSVIANPSLAIVRLVYTGDRALEAAAYETDVPVTFHGVRGIVSATITARRPPDLNPQIDITEDRVVVAPLLLNRADMFELQVLTDGKADQVTVTGRAANLEITERKNLPYSPGSGEEGEMLGFDRFMWWVPVPASIAALGITLAVEAESDEERLLVALATVLALVAYAWRTRYLVERRRLWKPPPRT